MRLIATLFLLFIATCCFAQMADTSKVIINNCWGRVKKDTAKVSLQNGLTGKVSGLNVQTKNNGVVADTRITMRCHRVLTDGDCRPLWLLDGVIKGLDSLASINPNDIMDVTILKSAEGTALFGPDGVNGVICITTKKYILRHLAIKDFTNGKPIPGATVSFISKSKNDTLFFKANDSGIVTTNKLRPGATYSIRVSSIGYKTLQQDFANTGKQYPKDILLAKDIKTCEEAILSVISCPRKISCGGYVRFTRKVQSEQKETGAPALQIKGYPNPVSKGAALTIQWKDVEKAVVELRLVSLDGRTVLRQPVTNKETAGNLQLSTDPRWASGLYFLQIICEKGRVLASEKIIIQ